MYTSFDNGKGDINAMKMKNLQERIYQNKLDKGFNVTDLNKEFCLLYGEVAEAYEAHRKKKEDFGMELADIAIYLLGIAEITGVDLEQEILKKMEINEQREYQQVDGVLIKFEPREK